MTKWKRIICLYPFFQEYIREKDADKFSKHISEYLSEFMMNVKKTDFDMDWAERFDYFIEELQGIIEYFEIHSEDGDSDEIDGELDNLYDLCNSHQVWVLSNHMILGNNRTESKLHEINRRNGYRSKILEKYKEVINV